MTRKSKSPISHGSLWVQVGVIQKVGKPVSHPWLGTERSGHARAVRVCQALVHQPQLYSSSSVILTCQAHQGWKAGIMSESQCIILSFSSVWVSCVHAFISFLSFGTCITWLVLTIRPTSSTGHTARLLFHCLLRQCHWLCVAPQLQWTLFKSCGIMRRVWVYYLWTCLDRFVLCFLSLSMARPHKRARNSSTPASASVSDTEQTEENIDSETPKSFEQGFDVENKSNEDVRGMLTLSVV